MRHPIMTLLLGAALAAPAAMMLPGTANAAAAMPAVQKLALVDLQKVLSETTHGKRSQSKLESTLKNKQKSLDKQRARLEADAAKLRSLKGQALQKAQESLQAESMDWQQKAMEFEGQLAEMEAKMLEEIYGNVQSIVKQIAKEQSLDMVLVKDQMTVIYTESNLDITGDVIKRYNKAHK